MGGRGFMGCLLVASSHNNKEGRPMIRGASFLLVAAVVLKGSEQSLATWETPEQQPNFICNLYDTNRNVGLILGIGQLHARF